MQEETAYSKTLKEITDLFQEESATLLTEEQIQDTLSSEQLRMERAEAAGIPCRQWTGMNLQRYSKELLRRHQLFFAGYTLLGFCTEVSCDLFFFYVIQWVLVSLTGQNIQKPLCVVPILIFVFVLRKNMVASYTRSLLANTQLPSETLSGRLMRFRIISGALLLGVTVLALSLFWDKICSVLLHMNLTNAFFIYVIMIMLYGIHNLIYTSHCILFFSVGIFSVHKRFADRKKSSMEWYITQKKKHSPASLRPHLVSMRVYIVLALFILVILDIICIINYLKILSLSILILGLSSLLLTVVFAVAFWGCQSLLSYLKKEDKSS
ncbi:MAG: hypothetical protein J1E62_01105 [Lachnospiraceae bacterium]|nr:hypothetical protein [Lachnospiraceae bacterium]